MANEELYSGYTDRENRDDDLWLQQLVPQNGNPDNVGLYIRDIESHKILSQEEVVDLAIVVEQAKFATQAIEQDDVPLDEMEQTKLEQIIRDGEWAKAILFESCSRWVISIAKKYNWRGTELEDLIQAGNIGLLKAIKHYDYRQGSLPNYASWWIRSEIRAFLGNATRTIRIPIHTERKERELMEIEFELSAELGRKPELGELSERSNLDEGEIKKLRNIPTTSSLDQLLQDGKGEKFGYDSIAISNDGYTLHDNIEDRVIIEEIEHLLGSLPSDQAEVIALRYGFVDGEGYSLEEVGKRLDHISRQAVSLREKKALERIREHYSIK